MSDFFEPTGSLDHFREEEREQTERDELAHDRELDQRYDRADWSLREALRRLCPIGDERDDAWKVPLDGS